MNSLVLPIHVALAAVSPERALHSPSSVGSDPPRIYGGELATSCQFPSTVYNPSAGCSGTLVHPRVIIHAGHCGTPDSFVFGETGNSPERTVATKWCEADTYESTDYAICVLDEAVEDIPIAPILQGCEAEVLQPGKSILLSGFGYANNADGGADFGIKRFVEVSINSLTDTDVMIGGMGGKGGCNGDSGGPAFVQLDDGTWRTFGSTHGGDMHPNCAEGSWKLTHVAMTWYEEKLSEHGESDIDLSPCFNESGDWEPTSACGGYAMDVAGPFGSWSDGCSQGAPLGPPSATCGPALDTEEPTVKIDSPADGDTFSSGKTVEVKVSASDNLAVTEVDLEVDGKAQGVVSQAPYTWMLDDLSPGEHTLVATAVDASKNESESPAITITVGDDDDDDDDTSSQGEDSSSDGESHTSDDDDDDDDTSQTTADDDDDTSNDDDDDDSASGDDDEDDDDDGDDDTGSTDTDNNEDDSADKGGCGSCQTLPKSSSPLWLAMLALAGLMPRFGRARRSSSSDRRAL